MIQTVDYDEILFFCCFFLVLLFCAFFFLFFFLCWFRLSRDSLARWVSSPHGDPELLFCGDPRYFLADFTDFRETLERGDPEGDLDVETDLVGERVGERALTLLSLLWNSRNTSSKLRLVGVDLRAVTRPPIAADIMMASSPTVAVYSSVPDPWFPALCSTLTPGWTSSWGRPTGGGSVGSYVESSLSPGGLYSSRCFLSGAAGGSAGGSAGGFAGGSAVGCRGAPEVPFPGAPEVLFPGVSFLASGPFEWRRPSESSLLWLAGRGPERVGPRWTTDSTDCPRLRLLIWWLASWLADGWPS